LFDGTRRRDAVSWNAVVSGHARRGNVSDALDTVAWMHSLDLRATRALFESLHPKNELQLFVKLLADDGVMPNEYTYDSVLRACVRLGALDFGRSVHGCLIRCGFRSEQLITSALVDLYYTSDALDDALLVYNDLDRPSLITSNTLIAGLISIGRTEDAKMVFSQVPEQDSGSYNLMIKAYAMEGKLEHCRRMFEKMPRRNMVSLNSMMSVLLQNGRLEEGLKLFKQIKDERDTITWNSMI